MGSAAGAADVVVFNVLLHLFLAPAVYGAFQGNAMLFIVVLNQLIGAETLLTLFAVHQGVRKSAQMSAGYPGLRIHQNGAVHTYVVGTLGDKLAPPGLLHIVLQLHAQISVIPGIGKSAVNLRPRVHKASCLGKSHDFFHCLFHRFFLSLFSFYWKII